jgi:hypothetical protein
MLRLFFRARNVNDSFLNEQDVKEKLRECQESFQKVFCFLKKDGQGSKNYPCDKKFTRPVSSRMALFHRDVAKQRQAAATSGNVSSSGRSGQPPSTSGRPATAPPKIWNSQPVSNPTASQNSTGAKYVGRDTKPLPKMTNKKYFPTSVVPVTSPGFMSQGQISQIQHASNASNHSQILSSPSDQLPRKPLAPGKAKT